MTDQDQDTYRDVTFEYVRGICPRRAREREMKEIGG